MASSRAEFLNNKLRRSYRQTPSFAQLSVERGVTRGDLDAVVDREEVWGESLRLPK
jgi:hypothetical protein